MVNVDRFATQGLAHGVGEDLHVAREHHQLRLLGLDDLHLFGLRTGLGGGCHGDVVKGDVVGGCELVKVTVVADDGFDGNGQQATLGAKEQIVQAVTLFAHKENRGHGLVNLMQVPLQPQGVGLGHELGQERRGGELTQKTHAHEK